MYYIYVDEAGTSAKEPVTVVIGFIVDADKKWKLAHAELNRALDLHVPPTLREGFLFHAKDIWSGYRDQGENWQFSSRKKLIEAVSSIPRRLNMAISIGKVRRDAPFSIPPEEMKKIIKPHDLQHVMAFGMCVRRANSYIRRCASENEVATVVAEDVPNMRRFIRGTFRANIHLSAASFAPTKFEIATGRMTQTNSGPVDKIIDTVHFVEKDGAPLLQIADACAFSFRRYFAGLPNGTDLIKAMLDSELEWEDWQTPSSEGVFDFGRKN